MKVAPELTLRPRGAEEMAEVVEAPGDAAGWEGMSHRVPECILLYGHSPAPSHQKSAEKIKWREKKVRWLLNRN